MHFSLAFPIINKKFDCNGIAGIFRKREAERWRIVKKVAEHIYQIKSSWEPQRTRASNLYLIHGDSRSLLIDAGFCNQTSMDTVERLLGQLSVPWNHLDVFVTHNHPDHAGLAGALSEKGARIFMKPEELESCAIVCSYYSDPEHGGMELLHSYGFSQWQAKKLMARSQAPEYRYHDYPWKGFPVTDVQTGQHLRYGEYDLEVLSLPGHTMHQIGLVERTHKWLFTSDTLSKRQVLTLASVQPGAQQLHIHLQTLDRLTKDFGDFWVVPGHYNPFYGTKKAVQNTKRYFAHMLQKVWNAMEAGNGEPWTLVEIVQKVFRYDPSAFFEEETLKIHFRLANTLSCLDELVRQGGLTVKQKNGVWYWAKFASLPCFARSGAPSLPN